MPKPINYFAFEAESEDTLSKQQSKCALLVAAYLCELMLLKYFQVW